MSLREQAIQRIVDLDADQVCQLVVRRITGDDTVPLGSRFSDEAGEDLVIWLLRDQDLPKEIRLAVISGCELVYSQILAWLAAPKHANGGNDLEDVATRLCRVVDVAGPGELRNHADAMLNLACTARDLPSRVLPAAVRACMSFGSTPDHVPLWEQLLQRREVAAYAFNALLAINPHANRITDALAMLWRKQLCDKWNVDTAFLARRAARLQGSEEIVGRVIRTLTEESSKSAQEQRNWSRLATELNRRDWSREWMKYIQDTKEQPKSRRTSYRSPARDKPAEKRELRQQRKGETSKPLTGANVDFRSAGNIAEKILKDELAAKQKQKQAIAAELRSIGKKYADLLKETFELKEALENRRENEQAT